MELFKTYKLWPIEPVKGQGCKVWDKQGNEYLDFYGGHAVISVGHCHPGYLSALTEQAAKLGFYSNAVENSLQTTLAAKLGATCGYPDYNLFLCNSGAEANENAMKLASFATGRSKILACTKAFHGRTSGAVAVTDNPKIQSPFNKTGNVEFIPLNDVASLEAKLATKEFAAVIIEGIQGVAGIWEPSAEFLNAARKACDANGSLLIMDEVQSGYGRTGRFYAHQHHGIKADIISMAKGMGNGFPIGAIIINPAIEATYGMLGTTFGGNHLACAAAIAVLDIINGEHLIENAAVQGEYLMNRLAGNPAVKQLRGRGLMVGIEVKDGFEGLRDRLLFEKHVFTGGAGANVIRLLPPLCISKAEIDQFIERFNELTA
ncbi:MAG: aspartate aminotransferase family protein [Bacteroidales bacterium]|nr:aspartate aminotransferase family protein [Bacteroidales bacterium]MBQ9529777.1 aspartate aminotransferase family protein [Bacteroidales bacterium]